MTSSGDLHTYQTWNNYPTMLHPRFKPTYCGEPKLPLPPTHTRTRNFRHHNHNTEVLHYFLCTNYFSSDIMVDGKRRRLSGRVENAVMRLEEGGGRNLENAGGKTLLEL